MLRTGVLRDELDEALLRRGDVLYLLMAEVEIPDEPLFATRLEP